MIGAVIGALVVGLIAMFAIVIAQGIYAGQNTSGWPAVLTSITSNIAPVIGIVGIIAMFLIVVNPKGLATLYSNVDEQIPLTRRTVLCSTPN